MGVNETRVVGGLVVSLGVFLSGVHLFHGIIEVTDNLPAVVSGAVVPFGVSLALIGGGVWIWQRTWPVVSPWWLVGWAGGGLVVGGVVSAVITQYQAAEGVNLSDPWFLLAMFVTYGAAFGLLLGRYDVQRRAAHARQVRKSDRLEEFANIISHDLRNPLNVAEGRLTLAQEECNSEHLNHVESALSRMEALLQDLLTLARGRELQTELQPVDLKEVARSCWGHVQTHDATLDIETTLTIQADRHRLQQLLENLFRNAIEHGGADVRITVGELADATGFYVEDTGPGIPEEERDHVFDLGYSTREAGTGFGLQIVQQIVDDHNWAVTVTEAADGGARFEITGVEAAT